MTTTEKKAKILAGSKTAYGFTTEIYYSEAHELYQAGLIERREVFTTGGNRKLRWFAK